MATTEDKRHAERLIREYTRRKRVLELRKAKQGDSADPAVEVEIEELEAGIAALHPLTKPEPPAEAKQLVERQAGGLDMTMLFVQGTQQNTRLTKIEEGLSDIREEQSRAHVWRVTVGEDIAQIPVIASALRHEVTKRVYGQWLNRAYLFAVAMFLNMWRRGGGVSFETVSIAFLETIIAAALIVFCVRLALWARRSIR